MALNAFVVSTINMTTTKSRRDPLSRYFKDLNDSDLDSDESEDETEVKADSKSKESPVIACDDGADINKSSVNSNSSSSDSNKNKVCETEESTSTPTKDIHCVKKLPSAHECFSQKTDPDFLKLNKKREINWDTSFKNLEHGENDTTSFGDYPSNAVPPPSSYEPVTDPGIKVVDSEGRRRKFSNDNGGDASSPKKAYHIEQQDL